MAGCFARAAKGVFAAVVLFATVPFAAAAGTHYTVRSSDGVEIAVEEAGNARGQPVVLVHGLLGSRINWDKQTSDPELQKFRLITYDLRGHGQSGKPDDVQAYQDGRRWADDLAAVLKESKAKDPILVGWSLGGVVLSNYLAAYGDAGVGGLVYVDGVIELKPDLLTPHREVYAGLASQDLRTHLDAVRTFLALCFNTQPDRDTFERLLSNAATASWLMTRTVPSMTVQAEEGLPRAKVPVLLIYGGKDNLVRPEANIVRAKSLNAQITSKIYDGPGHAPFFEEAPRFNKDLAEFAISAHVGR